MRLDEKGRVIHDLVCTADNFANELLRHCNWFSSVPDSVFKKVLPHLHPHQFSSRENHAIGAAFGAKLGGKRPAVLIQNSGLGLSFDALLGLFGLYQQGFVLVVSNRGELEWEEIQHHDWGKLTIPFLTTCGFSIFDLEKDGLAAIQKAAHSAEHNNTISVVLVHRGNLDE